MSQPHTPSGDRPLRSPEQIRVQAAFLELLPDAIRTDTALVPPDRVIPDVPVVWTERRPYREPGRSPYALSVMGIAPGGVGIDITHVFNRPPKGSPILHKAIWQCIVTEPEVIPAATNVPDDSNVGASLEGLAILLEQQRLQDAGLAPAHTHPLGHDGYVQTTMTILDGGRVAVDRNVFRSAALSGPIEVRAQRELDGSLSPSRRAELSAHVTGTLARLAVRLPRAQAAFEGVGLRFNHPGAASREARAAVRQLVRQS